MGSGMLAIVKTATKLAAARKEVDDLRSKVEAFEKRAAAEKFLLEMMESPQAPIALRPDSVADFMAKRASVEEQDIEVAKLAAKLFGGQDFGIGDPETVDDQPSGSAYNESRADNEFVDWLRGFGEV